MIFYVVIGAIGDACDSVGDAGNEVIVQTQMKYRGPM